MPDVPKSIWQDDPEPTAPPLEQQSAGCPRPQGVHPATTVDVWAWSPGLSSSKP